MLITGLHQKHVLHGANLRQVCERGGLPVEKWLNSKKSYTHSHPCSGFKEQNTFQLLVIKPHRASCSSSLNMLSVIRKTLIQTVH